MPLLLVSCAALWLSNIAPGAPGAPALTLAKVETWAPHPQAAPKTSQGESGEVVIGANGTRTCSGGWQFVYSGVRGGEAYRFRARARHERLGNARDSLIAMVLWDEWKSSQSATGYTPWNYLLPKAGADGAVEFEALLKAPEGANRLTVRYTLRWADRGSSRWTVPQIEPAALPKREPVTISVVNAIGPASKQRKSLPLSAGGGLPDDVAASVDLWATLILKACEQKPQLIVTPEVVIGGKEAWTGSIEVPGPATEPFQKIAREHRVHLVLGVREREGDALRNSAVLVSPEGKIAGVYRKVHLAISEGLTGVLPGDSFPVFDTPLGRIGCLICMDTTVCESARMTALNGADIVCFPIMGDLRASRWTPGRPDYDEDRWRAIMRTRAIDNQVCMAVARNNAVGSCIIDRSGQILAWNDGKQEVITATLPAEDGYRLWNGGDFREVTFTLRRPHLYEAYSDEGNYGPVTMGHRP